MAENKTRPTTASVDGFINAVENNRRRRDARVALELYESVTGLPAVMWGSVIVGFGRYAYRYASGREGVAPAAGFSPGKRNMTFYVGDEFDDAESLYTQLGKHRKSISCLYINKLDDVDLDVLREIVARDFARFRDRQ